MDRDAAQHLERLESLSGVGYFEVDEDRNITAVSPEVERITGFDRDEVLGRPCISLLRCPTCLRGCGVFEAGRVDDARISIYRKDGSEVVVERSGLRLEDEEGRVAGAFETLREVGASETDGCDPGGGGPEAVEALLEGLGRMFVAADGDLRVRAFSSRLPGLVGRSPETLRGLPLEALFGDAVFGPDGSLRKAAERGLRREGRRAVLTTAGGERLPLSLSVGPLPAEARCGHPDVRVVIMMRREEDGGADGTERMPSFHGIVGRSRSMQRVFRLVELVGPSESTVLVTGESGTGKELVARAIHATSGRADGPFVAVNCAALPSELLESELFGHVRGAFTGAVRDRAGRFEVADQGTLFLDEIGDLDPSLQAKILRALEERTFERVGDSRTRTVDVRVIAATHVDLERAVAEGRFREDLYYRLRVIPIQVPPLRERREDLPILVRHLLEKVGRRHQRALRLSPGASRLLLAHAWPGNVRELENALEFAVTVCEGQTIHRRDLPDEVRRGGGASVDPVGGVDAAAAPAPAPGRPELSPEEAAEVERIRGALLSTRYNRTRAAEALGISRTTLWRKMKQYGM